MAGKADGYQLIDASLSPSIAGVPYIDLAKVQGELPQFKKDEKLLLVCNKGKGPIFCRSGCRALAIQIH